MRVLCRGCGKYFASEVLLRYENMPKSAQFFPDKEDLPNEKGVTIELYQCPYCGLVQAAGEPVPYYRDVIRATGVSDEMTAFREKQFADWVREYGLEGRTVLEVGCGSGEYLNIMARQNVKVVGLEHRHKSVELGRGKGYLIEEGFLEASGETVKGAPFDGFYILNFLEHIPQPGEFLRAIASNLAHGSAGLVEVPNLDMILEKSLYSEFIQDHLTYFTVSTLRNLLEQNGFEVISCGEIWHRYIISARVRRRSSLDTRRFAVQRRKIQDQVNSFISRMKAEGGKIAVWGAGHQALANLSLLSIGDKIECVIDSASFKQNHYTPATHLPVVAPEELDKGEIRAVIIMAAGYSDEIRQVIERDYPGVRSVILREDGLEEPSGGDVER